VKWDGSKQWSQAGWHVHLPNADDLDALVTALGQQTIPALADESARRAGNRLAVTIDGEGITHAQLRADAVGLAGWLSSGGGPDSGAPAGGRVSTGGIRPGDRVLLAAGSSLGFLRC
jgi:acyl-CoA synthetase (AMP-forming)/AMP-acid ligase II